MAISAKGLDDRHPHEVTVEAAASMVGRIIASVSLAEVEDGAPLTITFTDGSAVEIYDYYAEHGVRIVERPAAIKISGRSSTSGSA